jgi:DnaJ family protein A protein 2
MPSFRHHDHGNLYIKFEVEFPQKDQLQNLELLEKVLPPRMEQVQPPADAMVEDFELHDIDTSEPSQARAHGAAGGMDEDDDDVPPGAERVQCASQ